AGTRGGSTLCADSCCFDRAVRRGWLGGRADERPCGWYARRFGRGSVGDREPRSRRGSDTMKRAAAVLAVVLCSCPRLEGDLLFVPDAGHCSNESCIGCCDEEGRCQPGL